MPLQLIMWAFYGKENGNYVFFNPCYHLLNVLVNYPVALLLYLYGCCNLDAMTRKRYLLDIVGLE